MRSLVRCIGTAVIALSLLLVTAAPVAARTVVGVRLTVSNWPMVSQTSARLTLSWTEIGLIRSREVILKYAVRSSGSCSGLAYAIEARSSIRSPVGISGLTPGYCYRWTVRVTDVYGRTAEATTAPVLVIPNQGYTFKVWTGATPNVQQAWNYTCVAASVQSELAIALGGFDASSVTQMSIYQWGRSHLGHPLPATEPGLDPHAWAEALNHFSSGQVQYADQIYTDSSAALKALATNMRRTGAAAGVAIKSGLHAWSIIGFTSSADPATTSAFAVTGLYVMAPYQAWTDPPAGTYYNSKDFVALWGRYYEPSGTTIWTGKYVIVTGG